MKKKTRKVPQKIPRVAVHRAGRGSTPAPVRRFFQRPATEAVAEAVARRILEKIRKGGVGAVVQCVRKFDGARIKAADLRVSARELKAAESRVSPEFRKAAREAHRRIRAFCKNSLRPDWAMYTPRGGRIGEMFVPLQRVGAYIPGGASPLASTALMSVTLAKEAGVPEIVACSPAGRGGDLDPNILFALHLAGATEVYRVGGIQAIGLMAYGAGKIRKVQKIVGPGGPYVTAAKRLVYGQVDLDMIAGPSEIAVLADESCPPAFIAADLLSQAEHGTGSEKALLVTTSLRTAEAVRDELLRQAGELPRREIVSTVLQNGTMIVVADSLDTGVRLINEFAPEHFELLVKNPEKLIPRFLTAGAIFVGPWTPEPAGDFAIGPSHVLPTGGAAAVFSGLSVESFRRRSSVMNLNQSDLAEMLPIIRAFSEVEQLEGHARSASIRFGT